MKDGQYVQVCAVPEAWEGAGEDYEDRESLIGHIGILVEYQPDTETWLVRFPTTDERQPYFQRCIEPNCLKFIANAHRPVSQHHLDQM